MVDLATLDVIRGRGAKGDLAAAVAWAASNRVALWAKWKEINEPG
jgi:hypothetical protein